MGWLYLALALPMREEDQCFPDRSFRYQRIQRAEGYLPNKGTVTAAQVREALAKAHDDFAHFNEQSAAIALRAADEADERARQHTARARAIEGEWSQEAQFGRGHSHPNAGRGGMRDRDLSRQYACLDNADACTANAAKYRRQAARMQKAAALRRLQDNTTGA